MTGLPPERLVVHGHSLGTIVALYVADNRKVGAVVLESPPTNAREWARSLIPWYAKPFVRLQFGRELLEDDNLQRVKRVSAPLLVIGGELDRETKPFMARRLFNAAATPGGSKTLLLLSGTGHMAVRDNHRAVDAYREFLDRHLRRE